MTLQNDQHRCRWCGATAFVTSTRRFVWLDAAGRPSTPPRRLRVEGSDLGEETDLRCARCNQPRFELLTLSTLRPFSQQKRPDGPDEKSVALGLAFMRPQWRAENPETVNGLSRDVELGVDDHGNPVADIGASCAPDLHNNPDDDNIVVYLEEAVEAAHDLAALVHQVKRLFLVVGMAIDAGHDFDPSEVYDCCTVVLGTCTGKRDRPGCFAFPGESHMRSPYGHGGECPNGYFWGRWERLVDPREPGSERAVAVLTAARAAFVNLADSVELDGYHPRRASVRAARVRWAQELASLRVFPAQEVHP